MYVNLSKSGLIKLIQQVSNLIRSNNEPRLMLEKVTEAVGWHFGLDRCVGMILDRERQELDVVAEYCSQSILPLGDRRYQLRLNSEWFQLLSEGRPLPLKDISLQSGEPSAVPELDQFIADTQSLSIVAFPLVAGGQLIGCLSMHYCKESSGFSDELLEFGESLVEEVAQGIAQVRISKERDMESQVFRDSQVPMLVLDTATCRILQSNAAACRLLDPTRKSLTRLQFLDFVPSSDGKRLNQACQQLLSGLGCVRVDGLVVRKSEGEPIALDSCLSLVNTAAVGSMLVVLIPRSLKQEGDEAGSVPAGPSGAKVEELVSTLSKQLQWERVARHITTSLSLTFDRDSILQTAVDSLGRVLGVNRGLIVKTEGPASPMVTHEYALPDISPLGLGRTSQFPSSAVACFKGRSAGFSDLSKSPKPTEMSQSDLKNLVEGGVVSMVGVPIGHHGQYHGLIIVLQNDKPRQWSPQELDLLETVADQAAVALNLAHSYSQLKDQLFNMNLIGNLAQQLTNVLDLATRSVRTEAAAEPSKPSGVLPPLSSRELEVLKLIASGLANREIAQRLFLTESTVELHASRIRKKLKLKSRTALVKYACDNHLV